MPITLSPPQRAILDRLLRQHTAPQALVRRIQIILAADAGLPNEQIAQQLGCSPKTARRWRARWAAAAPDLAARDADDPGLRTLIAAVLADAPRPGAPPTFTPEQIVQIIAIACTPPADAGRPVDAWTPRELADEAEKRQIVSSISARSVGRFLKTGRSEAAPQPLLAEHDGAGSHRLCRGGGDGVYPVCLYTAAASDGCAYCQYG
jgi:putative transposase